MAKETVNRSAKDGEFVSDKVAEANPDTTVTETVQTAKAEDEKPSKGTKYFYSIVSGLKFQVGDNNEQGKNDPDLLEYVAFSPVVTKINGESVRRGILVLEAKDQNKSILDRLEADVNVSSITKAKYEELRDGKQDQELK